MPLASDRVLENETIIHPVPCTWCGGPDFSVDQVSQLKVRKINNMGAGDKKAEGKAITGKVPGSFKEYLASLKKT